jgi:hypothetical protein
VAELTDILKAQAHFGTARVASASYISEWSIVRLADGRIGALAHHTDNGKPLVICVFGDQSYGVGVAKDAKLEIIKYSADLAREYLERQTKGDCHANHNCRE